MTCFCAAKSRVRTGLLSRAVDLVHVIHGGRPYPLPATYCMQKYTRQPIYDPCAASTVSGALTQDLFPKLHCAACFLYEARMMTSFTPQYTELCQLPHGLSRASQLYYCMRAASEHHLATGKQLVSSCRPEGNVCYTPISCRCIKQTARLLISLSGQLSVHQNAPGAIHNTPTDLSIDFRCAAAAHRLCSVGSSLLYMNAGRAAI